MRGKYGNRGQRRSRDNPGALNPNTVQNGHPTSNQNPELVAFFKTILPFWPDNMESASKVNNSTQFESKVNNLFETFTNPHEEFLDFLEFIISNDLRSNSGSCFSVHCIKIFNLFVSKNNDPNPVEISNELKLRAFLVSSRSPIHELKKLIFNLYKFADSLELLKIGLPQIKKPGFYIQSSQWICLFNAEDQFEICDYLFPMLLEKNIDSISSYVNENPNKVNEIVKLMDTLGKDKRAIQNAFTEFTGQNLNGSEMSLVDNNTFKMIKYCIKHFNISPELTPNYNQRNAELEINFYVHSLVRLEMSEEAFEERVIALCEANPSLQRFLIKALKSRGLYQHAQKFSKIFNMPVEEVPILPPREPPEVIEFYSVDNLIGMTVFVDTKELCKSMLQFIDTLIRTNAGSESTIPVGLDLEWKSVCTATSILPPALLQVAFDKRVFIVDVNKLHSNTDFWMNLNDKLLKNEKFSKLGYGLQNDQGSFKYYPNLGFISMKGVGYIDLNKEERKYISFNNPNAKKFLHNVPDSNRRAKGQRGLSRLVYYCFGKFLDKREVLSDWNRRPLREAQLLYAAMDAYCLLDVYKVLEEMHKKSGNNFDSATVSSKKPNIIPERAAVYRKPWSNQFLKKRFWRNTKKKTVAVQTSVECNTIATQTQPDLTSSVAALTI